MLDIVHVFFLFSCARAKNKIVHVRAGTLFRKIVTQMFNRYFFPNIYYSTMAIWYV